MCAFLMPIDVICSVQETDLLEVKQASRLELWSENLMPHMPKAVAADSRALKDKFFFAVLCLPCMGHSCV